MNFLGVVSIITLFSEVCFSKFLSDNFFERLGVTEESSDREIRIGFKKMALHYHPDKNLDDPDSYSKMVELNEAMSTLLDPERRAAYEHGGKKGLDNYDNAHDHSHRSYDEYEQYGPFDDEAAIEQLTYHSWEASHPNMDSWFIFLYAARCGSMCTNLYEPWKEVARRLVDIAHVSVANCDTAYPVCYQLRVTHFPYIVLYKKGKKRGYQQPIIYDNNDGLEADKLIEFALNALPDDIQALLPADFIDNNKLPFGGTQGALWVVGYCYDATGCVEMDKTLIEVDDIVGSHVAVGKINCQAFSDLCKNLGMISNSVGYLVIEQDSSSMVSPPSQQIAHTALKKLPPLPILGIDILESITEVALSDDKKHVSQTKMSDSPAEYLVLFINQDHCEPDTEIGPGTAFCNRALLALRNVISILKDDWEYGKLTVSTFPCHESDRLDERYRRICDGLKLTSQPKMLHLKDKGLNPHAYHDRLDRVDQILGFVEEVYKSIVHTLLQDDFEQHVVKEKQIWFIDFYAPWCHHCRDVWPEWNLASKHYDLPKDHEIHFGKIDCGIHVDICNEHHIRGYPSFLLYIDSIRHQFDFDHRTAEEFVRFAKENLQPTIQEFDIDLYKKTIYDPSDKKALPPSANFKKPNGEHWIVDFFAPWCSHCHLVKPKFKEASISLRGVVKFGQFNCELDEQFCQNLGVRTYPSIWKFDTREDCSNPKASYTGVANTALLLEFVMKDIPDYVTSLDPDSFKENKIGEKSDATGEFETSWLIFYASKESECKKCDDVDLRIRALSARYREKEESQKTAGQIDPVATAKPLVLRFGKIDCRETGLVWTFCVSQQVRKFPGLVYYSSVTGEGTKINSVDNLEIISQLDREMDQDRRETASPFRGNPSSWRFHDEL